MDAYRVGEGLAALGGTTRRAIVAALAEGPRAVGELAAGLPVSRPAVSQALEVLEDAGLVGERAAGTRRIFRVFTGRFGDVRPCEHNLLDVPIAETVLEPRVGGTIYDRGTDGSECHWARVLVFEPPHRVVFSWDIGPTWEVETDPENASEVEVRFLAEGPHRNLDRHGPGWQSVGDGVGDDRGWPLHLARYAALFDPAA